MAEYISREAAINAMYEVSKKNHKISFYVEQLKALENIPAAEVAPVRRGRWLETVQPCGWRDEICAECSECGEDFVLDEWGMEDMENLMHYCPNCGASMVNENE